MADNITRPAKSQKDVLANLNRTFRNLARHMKSQHPNADNLAGCRICGTQINWWSDEPMTKTICSAFGCPRWTRRLGDHGVYLCPVHWRMVPRKLRRLHCKAYRIAERTNLIKHWRRSRRFWDRCVTAANSEQFGIGVT